MLSGVDAYTGRFLSDLANIQDRIGRETTQVSSGHRVQQSSDDPFAVPAIIAYQKEISRVTQIQSNLNVAKTAALTADDALQSASQIMQNLLSLGAQGISSTSDASTRKILAQQVQQLQQQLVNVANTSVQGRYIFGGDSPDTPPYTFDLTQAKGVVDNNAPATVTNTIAVEDASGNKLVPSMTAQQIFDAQDSLGNPTSANIFNAVYSLGQALENNDQSGIQSSVNLLKSANDQLSSATIFYGNTENWLDSGITYATQHVNDLTIALGSVRDADVVQVATQLSADKMAMDAAIAAHASLSHKSLFDYLG
jgi:flagellar hook-associated protein 3 FlgL